MNLVQNRILWTEWVRNLELCNTSSNYKARPMAVECFEESGNFVGLP